MPPNILILGGGFAGVYAARRLARRASVTLVSRENSFLFQAMLPEVAAGTLDPRDILTPIRALCPTLRFIQGDVTHIDLERRVVRVRNLDLPFDHLLLALGSVQQVRGLSMKTIGDALSVRNHVIRALEDADADQRPLTLVVAGGGFSGVETVAALNDFVRRARRFYPRLGPIRVVLVHLGDRILPELDAELAQAAHRHLESRGVEIRLGLGLTEATAAGARLSDGSTIDAAVVVSTIVLAPNPLVAALPLAKDEKGRIKVDARLEAAPGVWAVGDCASIVNPETGRPYPPSAQFAVRQGLRAAENILARLRGLAPKPFDFRSMGQFATLGHHYAIARIRGIPLRGFAAWWLWRTIYLMKLPGWHRRMRVAMHWTVELFFPPDIVEVSYTKS